MGNRQVNIRYCYGLDGITGGWIAATRVAGSQSRLQRLESMQAALALVTTQRVAALVVDIPIGLLSRTPRRADVEARAFLGRKHSSVFSSPYHAMLSAAALPLRDAQKEAGRLRRELDGGRRGCTIQATAILPKIAEAERAITATEKGWVFEGHPEVTIAILNGGSPVLSKKDRVVGRDERLALLLPYFGDLRPYVIEGRKLGAQPDDVLDAFAMLWTAERIARADPHLRRFPTQPEPAVGGKTAQIVA
jgi:predicted RNase H-like nuclease